MLFNLLNHKLFQTCPLDSEEKDSFKKHSLVQHLQNLCYPNSTTNPKKDTDKKTRSHWFPPMRYLDVSEIIFLLIYVIYNKEEFNNEISEEGENGLSSDEELEALQYELQKLT